MRDCVVAVFLTLVILSAGCTSSEPRSAPAPVKEVHLGPSTSTRGGRAPDTGDVEVRAYRPAAAVAIQEGNAVFDLVEEAETQSEAGNFSGAAATLERALRIEPRNPHLWNRLAHVRLQQGRFEMAGDLAAKSSTLAGDNPGLKRDNWLIIAQSRRAAGDTAGAAAAERAAQALR